MGFLEKVKANSTAAAATPKPNPMNASNPLAAKKPVEVVETAPQEAPKPATLPVKKNPFSKNVVEEVVSTPETPVTPVPTVKKNPFGPKATTVAPTPVENPTAKTEVAEKGAEVELEATETPKEEATTPVQTPETTKKTRKARTTTAVKEETPKEEENLQEVTPMTFAEATLAVKGKFVDEEWEAYMEEISTSIDEIVIDPDMNPAIVKQTLAELSKLKDSIWLKYAGTKSLYDRLASEKPEGLIERTKRINLGTGTNDLERKKAGVLACMRFVNEEGQCIDLFEIADEARDRQLFFEGVLGQIKFKSSVLITYSGAMKLDKELMP